MKGEIKGGRDCPTVTALGMAEDGAALGMAEDVAPLGMAGEKVYCNYEGEQIDPERAQPVEPSRVM